MNRLSDKLLDIDDSWVIESGRYAALTPMNQRLLSTTINQAWAIEMAHATASRNLAQNRAYLPALRQTSDTIGRLISCHAQQ